MESNSRLCEHVFTYTRFYFHFFSKFSDILRVNEKRRELKILLFKNVLTVDIISDRLAQRVPKKSERGKSLKKYYFKTDKFSVVRRNKKKQLKTILDCVNNLQSAIKVRFFSSENYRS